jgi:RNA polymerase sigma-70 factor (ECF subfamily)
VKHRTDVDLIQKTLSGETEAFGELIQRYQDAVYATALHRTRDFASAQDVAQEAFIEAYRSLHRLREPAKFPSWLHTITLHQYHRWRRKQRETIPIEGLSGAQMMEISDGRIPLPDETLERSELRQIVLHAIASLPEKVGEVVTMYYADGLSYNEIANFLSIPKTTVKGRLQMGRKQLREGLIDMVEKTLKQNRPDEEFTSRVVNAAVKRAQDAFERRNDPKRARRVIEYCSKALKTLAGEAHNLDYQRLQGDILKWQGYTWLHPLKQPQRALQAFEESLQLAKGAADKPAEIDALMGIADAFVQLGEVGKAEESLQQALEQARTICDRRREGAVRYRQSRLQMGELKDIAQIHTFLRSVESIATEIGNRAHAMTASVEIAHLQHQIEEDRTAGLYGRPQAAMQALLDVVDLIPESFPDEADPNSPFAYGYFDIKREASAIRVGFCPQIRYTGHAKESNSRMWLEGVSEHLFRQRIGKPLALPTEPANLGLQSQDERENLRRQLSIESADETLQGKIFRFPHCMKLKIAISKEHPEPEEKSTVWVWFARGVGLVKIRYLHDNEETTEIDLIDYRLTELSDDYFPLSPDNIWLYCWSKSKGSYTVTEKWRVLSRVYEPDYANCPAYRLTNARYYLYMPEISKSTDRL